MINQQQLFTAKQLAMELYYSAASIYRLAYEGKIPPGKKTDGIMRWDLAEVTACLARNQA